MFLKLLVHEPEFCRHLDTCDVFHVCVCVFACGVHMCEDLAASALPAKIPCPLLKVVPMVELSII